MDTILRPFMWVIAWVMDLLHRGLVLIGMSDGSGPAWVLAIIGLTVIVRLLILPLYNKQIRSSRQMQVIQPEMQKIQKKYKGKRDQVSQQRMAEELQALYRKHGTSPYASCMPMLVQMPILFSMYRLLYQMGDIATGAKGKLGPIDATRAADFEASTVFGAPLSSAFNSANQVGAAASNVRIVAAVLVVLMCVTMFVTQRQLLRKNMPEASRDKSNPMYRTQQYMMYGMPLMYIFMGGVFQVGVLVYWVSGNIWNMCQQAWFIRNNPTPGSQAYKEREARLRAKRLRQGLSDEEIAELEAGDVARAQGRVQPLGKERSKKAAEKAANYALYNQDQEEEQTDDEPVTEVRGKDGLTDEERARRRYERRQAERARAKQKQANRKKRAQQNQKKRNF